MGNTYNTYNYNNNCDDCEEILDHVKSIRYDVNGIKSTVNGLVDDVNGVMKEVKSVKFQVSQINNSVAKISQVADNIYDLAQKNFAGINRNFDAITSVEARLNATFAITQIHLTEIERKLDTVLSAVESAKNELKQELKKIESSILHDIRRSEVSAIVSDLNGYFESFLTMKEHFESKLSNDNNLLKYLDSVKNKLNSNENSLYTLLNKIMGQQLYEPKDANDELAFVSLRILIRGLQFYAVNILFLTSKYMSVSYKFYTRNDLEQFNNYRQSGLDNFNSLTKLFNGLTLKASDIFDKIKSTEFIVNERTDLIDYIKFEVATLSYVSTQMNSVGAYFSVETPSQLFSKLDFSQSNITTPVGNWIDEVEVSYAFQSKVNDSYSLISEWSDPFEIFEKANPVIKIPKISFNFGQSLLIFRKFTSAKAKAPELAGIITSSEQSMFHDINRDIYNFAKASNENYVIKNNLIELYIQNGANVNAAFEMGRQALHGAVKKDNSKIAIELIKNGANVDAKDDEGSSPLHIAIKFGFSKLAHILIDAKADINARNNLGQTPLHIAAFQGEAELVDTLLQNDEIRVNVKTLDGFTPLHAAIIGGQTKIVESLLSDNRTNVDAKSIKKFTALHLAAIYHRIDILKVLLNNKRIVDANVKAQDDATALHLAVKSNKLDIVTQLLSHDDIDVNARMADGYTPLHIAIEYQISDIALELMKHTEIDVNIQAGSNNLTPLHLAAIKGKVDIVKKLLELRAKFDLLAVGDVSALHFAVAHAKEKVVTQLMEVMGSRNSLMLKKSDGSIPLHSAAFSGDTNLIKLTKAIDIIDFRDQKEYTPLYVALKYNYTKAARSLMDSNANIRFRLSDYQSLLHFAASEGSPNAVINLIENGVRVDVGDRDLAQPIHYAAQNGNLEVIKLLINNGANVNAVDRSHTTPLHYIARLDQPVAFDIVNILIGKNADINSCDNDNFTVLHFAAQSGNYRLVKLLIQKGADINFSRGKSSTPLHLAAQSNRVNVVKVLLENRASVDIVNNEGLTPLHLAIKGKGDLSVIKLLVNSRSDLKRTDSKGLTLVDEAILSDKMDIALFLIENNVEFREMKKNGWSLLHYFAKGGNTGLVEKLLHKADTSINAKNNAGETPLHLAIKEKGDLRLVEFLASKGADLNSVDDKKVSLLLEAIRQKKNEIAEFLIEKGVDVNIKNYENISPLHIAAENGNLDLVTKLLIKNADVNAQTYIKQCPLRYAIKGKGDLRMVWLLKEKFGNLNAKDNWKNTLLHEAILVKKQDVVTFLIEQNVDFNIQNDSGNTALHFAAKIGNIEATKRLVEMGADIDAKNKYNSTPLHLAVTEKGTLEVVKYLLENNAYAKTRDLRNLSLLEEAIDNNKFEIAEILLKYGVEIGCHGCMSLLHRAAEEGMLGLAKLILTKKYYSIDINSIFYSQTALQLSVKGNGNLAMFNLLVDNGADLNAKDQWGTTILHEAALKNKVDIGKQIIKRDVSSVDMRKADESTPLHIASEEGNLEFVKLLLENGADLLAKKGDKYPVELAKKNGANEVVTYLVNFINKQGNTLMHEMALRGDLRMVKFSLDNMVNVDRLNRAKHTALHLAAQNGHLNLVKYLVAEKCANLDLKNDQNQTALDLAQSHQKHSVVEYLLANKNFLNSIKKGNFEQVKNFVKNQGVPFKCRYSESALLPIELASESGKLDIVKFFIEQGGTLTAKSVTGEVDNKSVSRKKLLGYFVELKLHLFQSIQQNNLDEMKKYCSLNGFYVNFSNQTGYTPLHVATAVGNVEIVKYLIEVGNADQQAKTFSSQTPLDLAVVNSHEKVVDYLITRNREQLYNAITRNDADSVKQHLFQWDIVKGNDKNGWTALHVAAHHGSSSMVQLLLKNGASNYVKNYNNQTPLDLAKSRKRREAVQSLINYPNNHGTFMLHEAAARSDFDQVKWLIENNADVNIVDSKKETALHAAVKGIASLELIKLLVDSGASLQAKDMHGSSLVFNAMLKGKINIVKYFVDAGADVNAPNQDGWTPLHEAVEKGKFSLVKYLLNKNVNINAMTKQMQSPLSLIITKDGSLQMFILLVAKGADVLTTDANGNSLVMMAIMQDRLDILDFLFSQQVDINLANKDGWTVLHETAKRGNLPLIRSLITKNAKIEAKTKDDESPLIIADTYHQKGVVSMLLNIKDASGNTMLHRAASKGKNSIVKYLLEKGSKINEPNFSGFTPLHIAIQSGQIDIVQTLFDNGANVCAKTSNGLTPFKLATRLKNNAMIDLVQNNSLMHLINLISLQKSVDKVREFISKGANINCPNESNGWTPLHYAARVGQLNMVKLLIKSGANISALTNSGKSTVEVAMESDEMASVVPYLLNTVDINDGFTKLHVAAAEGNLNMTKYYLDNGAKINIANKNDVTPLHMAAKNGHFELCKFLLDNTGVEINAKSKEGKTPFHYAAGGNGTVDLAELFKQKGSNFNETDKQGRTAIFDAVSSDRLEFVDYLVGNSIDVNLPDINQMTSLHVATQLENDSIAKFLISKGATVDIKNLDGKTPLHLLVSSNNEMTNLDLVKNFISKNANINTKDNTNTTLLLESILKGNFNVTNHLLEHKSIDAHVPNKIGWTPLHEAAKIGNVDLIKKLLNCCTNVDVNAKDKNGHSPLHIAVKETGKLSVAKVFLESGADAKTKDNTGTSLLIDAAAMDSIELVKELITRADVDEANNAGVTPLHEAAKLKTSNLFRYLINHSKNIDAKNAKGQTPLQVSICEISDKDVCYTRVSHFVFTRKVNIRTRDNRNSTLILDAIVHGQETIVEALITNGVDYDAANVDGSTPLHEAVKRGQIELVELLLNNNAKIDVRDNMGWTPMHYAAAKGLIEIIQKLILSGATNVKNNHGKYPLNLAIDEKMFDTAKYLIAQNGTASKTVSKRKRELPHQAHRFVRDVNQSLISDVSTLQLASSAPKTTSWINVATNSVLDVFKSASAYMLSGHSDSLPKDSFSTLQADIVSQPIDVNSSLLLLDVAIRKLTGQRYISTCNLSMSVESAKSAALELTVKVEKLINNFAVTFQLENRNLDYFELFKSIESLLISGECLKISDKLLSTATNVYPEIKENAKEFCEAAEKLIYQNFGDNLNVTQVESESDDFNNFIKKLPFKPMNSDIVALPIAKKHFAINKVENITEF